MNYMIRNLGIRRFADLTLGSLLTLFISCSLVGSDVYAGPISRGLLELFEEAEDGARVLGLQGSKKSLVQGNHSNKAFKGDEVDLAKLSSLHALRSSRELRYSGVATFQGNDKEIKVKRLLKLGEPTIRSGTNFQTVIDELFVEMPNSTAGEVVRAKETQFFEGETSLLPRYSTLDDYESITNLSYRTVGSPKTLPLNNKIPLATYVENDSKGRIITTGEVSVEVMISKKGEPVLCITSIERPEQGAKYTVESTCTYYNRLTLVPQKLVSNVTLDDGEIFSMELVLDE